MKFGSPTIFPDSESKIGLAIETLDKIPISGSRMNPENGTNGWYIWGGDYSDNDDFYKAVHLNHLSEILPQVLPYLALAPGYKFIIDNDGYEDVWHDPELLLKK